MSNHFLVQKWSSVASFIHSLSAEIAGGRYFDLELILVNSMYFETILHLCKCSFPGCRKCFSEYSSVFTLCIGNTGEKGQDSSLNCASLY